MWSQCQDYRNVRAFWLTMSWSKGKKDSEDGEAAFMQYDHVILCSNKFDEALC